MVLGFAVILIGGFLAGRLFKGMGLPALLGALAVGVMAGPYGFDILPAELLHAGSELRLMALTLILLRAGLGLNRDLLSAVGMVAFRMSFLPCIFEGAAVTAAGMLLFSLPFAEAGMLGFIIAAVSPAVVVPAMLSMKESGLGMDKGVPVIILAGAALDDAFAITLFSAFVGLAAGGNFGGPLQIPGQVIWSVAGGILLGVLAYILFMAISRLARPARTESSIVSLGLALLAVFAGESLKASGPLAALVFGFVLLEKLPEVAAGIDRQMTDLWAGAQLMLFVLIGAAVQVPLAWTVGPLGLLLLFMGLTARSGGVFLALAGSQLNLKERLFAAIAYMPKATVQAAIGGVPLALGLPSGPLILALAVLSIVVTAPLGAIAIARSAPRLLEKDEAVAVTAD